jgi:pimeloyl-ACP methyl ester carboxylesterase
MLGMRRMMLATGLQYAFLLVADLSLVHDRGGSGEPLVLVHGIGSCWRCWDPVVSLLQEHHDVIALDLPGYGDSPAIEDEPTIYAITDALDEALLAAGLDGAHLVGNSMGGWIVAELAGRGRAKTAVVISPAGLATEREIAFAKRTLGPAQGMAKRIAPHVDRIAATAVGRAMLMGQAHSRPWRAEAESVAHQVRAYANSESFVATLEWACSSGSQPRDLDKISCPFRVLWGTLDFVLPYRQAKRWVQVVPGAELVTLKGLGHVPMPDDPQLVAKSILEVTSATPAPRTPAAAPA